MSHILAVIIYRERLTGTREKRRALLDEIFVGVWEKIEPLGCLPDDHKDILVGAQCVSVLIPADKFEGIQGMLSQDFLVGQQLNYTIVK